LATGRVAGRRCAVSVSVLHVADLHLDSKIAGLDTDRRQVRRQELKESFARVCSLAKERAVQIVLIAGDMFDGDTITRDTAAFVVAQLESLAPARVFISPGNHDPYTVGGWRAIRENLPEHVTIFEEKISCVELPDLGVRVYGAGFSGGFINHPVLDGFSAPQDDMINLMVLHGEVCTPGVESSYNPVYPGDIAKSGLDYLALGHVHTHDGLHQAGGVCYAYAGTHEGHGFDECGDKGVLIGEVDKGRVRMEFIPTCLRRYHRLELDITDCATAADMTARVCAAAEEKRDLYRIYLDGTAEMAPPTVAIAEAVGAFACEVIDRTRPRYDLNALAADYSLKGIFARNVRSALENATDAQEAERVRKACDLVLRIFDKGGAL